jgi:hypothetical protein
LCSVVDPDSDPHGSVFNWLSQIWIRTGNADPDPGASKLAKIIKQTWFPAFQKSCCTFVGVFFELFSTSSTFFM